MKINVLGLGNVIFGDEGFGVEIVNQLQNYYNYPDFIDFIDGGTQGIYLLDYVEAPQRLLIIDAIIPIDYEPGIYVYHGADLPKFIHRKLSSHQIGLSELLSLATLHGKLPEDIALIGVPPHNMEMGVGLSPQVKALIPEALQKADQVLHTWIQTN